MRSIKRRFNKSRNTTSITKFYDAVCNQNFSEDKIRRWFNKLVDSDDYHPTDKRTILKELYKLTKTDCGR
jgi:hypothetical protein